MTMKTITYDPTKYKLVPIKATPEILAAVENAYPGDVLIDGIAENIWVAGVLAATEYIESNHEVVCWAPLFKGDETPSYWLSEETREELVESTRSEFIEKYIPLIAKPD